MLKAEIKALNRCHKNHWDNMYPGYPLAITVSVDLETKEVWITKLGFGYKRKTTIEKLGDILSDSVMGTVVTIFGNRGSFTQNEKWDTVENILQGGNDDFYLNDVDPAKFYYAMYVAIKKNLGKKGFVFGQIIKECDYVGVEEFMGDNALEKINKYTKDYCE